MPLSVQAGSAKRRSFGDGATVDPPVTIFDQFAAELRATVGDDLRGLRARLRAIRTPGLPGRNRRFWPHCGAGQDRVEGARELGHDESPTGTVISRLTILPVGPFGQGGHYPDLPRVLVGGHPRLDVTADLRPR